MTETRAIFYAGEQKEFTIQLKRTKPIKGIESDVSESLFYYPQSFGWEKQSPNGHLTDEQKLWILLEDIGNITGIPETIKSLESLIQAGEQGIKITDSFWEFQKTKIKKPRGRVLKKGKKDLLLLIESLNNK